MASVHVSLITSEIQNIFLRIYWPFRFPVLKTVSLSPLLIFWKGCLFLNICKEFSA